MRKIDLKVVSDKVRDLFIDACENIPENVLDALKKAVEEELEKGNNVFLEIDVKGALNIIRDYPECVSIFILPPDFETLEKRLRKRATETEEQIRFRLETALREISFSDRYTYNVVNGDIDKAVEEVLSIIRKETGRE